MGPTRLAQTTEMTPLGMCCPWMSRAMLPDVWVQRQPPLSTVIRAIFQPAPGCPGVLGSSGTHSGPELTSSSSLPWCFHLQTALENCLQHTETTLSMCGYHQFCPLKNVKYNFPTLYESKLRPINTSEISELVTVALGPQAELWPLCSLD